MNKDIINVKDKGYKYYLDNILKNSNKIYYALNKCIIIKKAWNSNKNSYIVTP